MWCPKCAGKTKVIGTVTGTENERFRRCKECDHAFQTVEAIRFDTYWKEYAQDTFNHANKLTDDEHQNCLLS